MAVQAARIVFPAADREEIAAATVEILASGTLTLGPYSRQFETAFAAAHSADGSGAEPSAVPPHAVAVSSGTAALEIILRGVGVTGRDVIVPANTFFATAEAAIRAGGRPVFADIDPRTFALSPQTVIAANRGRLVRESSLVKCSKKKIAGAIASKYATGAISPVRRGSKPDDQ